MPDTVVIFLESFYLKTQRLVHLYPMKVWTVRDEIIHANILL